LAGESNGNSGRAAEVTIPSAQLMKVVSVNQHLYTLFSK